jgi:hypothetical protein
VGAQRILVRVFSEKNELACGVGSEDAERPAPGFVARSGREFREQRVQLRHPADESVQLGDHDDWGSAHTYIVA